MSEGHTDQQVRPEGGGAGYEKRDVAVGRLVAVTLAAVVILSAVLVGLFQLFVAESEHDIQEMVLAPESATLRELRAHEDGILHSFGVIDNARGQYRIPIERAMELVADEAFRNRSGGGDRP